jgi:hypothetical protein
MPRENSTGEMLNCICQEPAPSTMGSSLLDTFAAVRERCSAINQLLVPDEIWPKFHNWHLWSDGEAHHESTLLLALDRGDLSSITSPLHRYLLESGCINSRVRTQYIIDLQENWIGYSDPLERHEKFKTFQGRVAELQCAEWLERDGWEICDLEAYRERSPDIEAKTTNGDLTALEVKFIGQDNGGFDSVLQGFREGVAYERRSPYCAVNYLLFQIYRSAKQLQRSAASTRIAVVVIDDLTWDNFQIQLKEGWINWKNPTFMDAYDSFIDGKRKDDSNLDAELKTLLRSINDVWIVKRSSGNRFQIMFSQHGKE